MRKILIVIMMAALCMGQTCVPGSRITNGGLAGLGLPNILASIIAAAIAIPEAIHDDNGSHDAPCDPDHPDLCDESA